MEVDVEVIGELADRVDNLIAADQLPIPEPLRTTARREALTDLRNDIREIYRAATGDDPWSDGGANG